MENTKQYKSDIKRIKVSVSQWDSKILMRYKDLEAFYIDWFNDYLTIDKMADDYGMNYVDTKIAIDNGRKVFNNK
tara:strand:+ start:479 stop:703 length:225 start_codon:yes stop_codon:yes gene_type:complete